MQPMIIKESVKRKTTTTCQKKQKGTKNTGERKKSKEGGKGDGRTKGNGKRTNGGR